VSQRCEDLADVGRNRKKNYDSSDRRRDFCDHERTGKKHSKFRSQRDQGLFSNVTDANGMHLLIIIQNFDCTVLQHLA
jgi:hypothetical protein